MIEFDYLTPEDFKTAEANGISYMNAYHRYYVYGWEKEKAITVPVKKRSESLWHRYRERCKEAGVSQHVFYDRVRYKGWTPENASTTPYQKPSFFNPDAKVNQDSIKIAKANGISERTLKRRVYTYKWEVERARTEPINAQYRRKDLETNRVRS